MDATLLLDATFLDVAYLGCYGFGCFTTEPAISQ